jgi:uncharacterized integral membrane protein
VAHEVAIMRYILGVILLIFLGAIGIFALQNTQLITVRFLTWSSTAPAALTIVASYLFGMVSGWNVVAFLRHSFHRVTAARRTT